MNKRWRNIGLYVLIVVVVIFVGSAFFDKPSQTRATRTLRYSDFIEAVQEKQVSRVLISPDKGTAQIVESDGNRALVNLAPDQQLLQLLVILYMYLLTFYVIMKLKCKYMFLD